MDAFAVAIASSVSLGRVSGRQTFRLAFHFGFFQAMMPVLGWVGVVRAVGRFAGRGGAGDIGSCGRWVAFGLLAVIGGKAVMGALQEEDEDVPKADPTRGLMLVTLSVATSLDALAVGLSFAMLKIRIWWPAVIIGLVAGAFTTVGMQIGSRLGARFGRRMEVAGGLVLSGIGLKIVADHVF